MVTLRTLQSAANNQHSSAPMTWRALQSQGISIDYDAFAARWESDPILKQLVDRFDANGLVIKTNNGEDPQQHTGHKENELARMAKRAAHKHRQFD